MKKILFVLILLNFSIIHANLHHTMIEIKPAYFQFQDDYARNIFNSGGFMPSIEIDSHIYNRLHWFAELGFLYKEGHSHITDSDTNIYLLPISVGLKQFLTLTNDSKLYLKLAPNWIWAKEHQEYPGFKRSFSLNTFGATLGLGFLLYPVKHWTIDLFTNYLYDRTSMKNKVSHLKTKLYLGGFQIGFGIGYRW